jgi:hypothetical protein
LHYEGRGLCQLAGVSTPRISRRINAPRAAAYRAGAGAVAAWRVPDDAWSAELDRFADVPFMEGGRRQPPLPEPPDPKDYR